MESKKYKNAPTKALSALKVTTNATLRDVAKVLFVQE